jgi:hypothetical protein
MKKFFNTDTLLNIAMYAIYYATFLSLFAYFGHWQTGIFYTAFGAILYIYSQTDSYNKSEDMVRLHAVGGYVVCLIIYAYYCIKVLKLQGNAAGLTVFEFVFLIGQILTVTTKNRRKSNIF